jgi:hypothetical protein
MSTSYSRGWKTYFDGEIWRYCDNNNPLNEYRQCKKCGRSPTKEGYDACLGYIEGAKSACCGHGVSNNFIIMEK